MKIIEREEEEDCDKTSDKHTSKESNKKGRPQEEKRLEENLSG